MPKVAAEIVLSLPDSPLRRRFSTARAMGGNRLSTLGCRDHRQVHCSHPAHVLVSPKTYHFRRTSFVATTSRKGINTGLSVPSVSPLATHFHSAPTTQPSSRAPSPVQLVPPFTSTPVQQASFPAATSAYPVQTPASTIPLDKPASLTMLDEEGYNYPDWLRVQSGYMKYLGVHDIAKGTIP